MDDPYARREVGKMRLAVLLRDGGCVAPRLDPDAGPCYDKWGYPLTVRAHVTMTDLEADYILPGHHGSRHELPEDHVAVCPGHHRGAGPNRGSQWATANRERLRAYLDSLPGGGRVDV